MTNPVVLVVGSLHYDIMVDTDTLPRKDETAIGSRWYPKFGGKGGNQAVASAKTAVTTRMAGAVGCDAFGRFLRQTLKAGAVDDRFVLEIDSAGSGMSVAIMDRAGDYAATIVSGANLLIPATALREAALWADVAVLVLQNEVPEAINIAAAGIARAHGIRTLLNAAPFRALAPELCALVDILVVNAVEAEQMGAGAVSTLEHAQEAARKLGARFPVVIVTAGAQGLALRSEAGDLLTIPAQKIKAVSSHGAGDAFVGTLAGRLAQGEGLEAACHAASAAAARHVAGL